MSPISRPLPELLAIDVPFIDLIISFFGQVLHVPSPEHLVIRDFRVTTDMYESPLMRRLIPAEYMVTIVLDTPLPSLGDKIRLSLDKQDGTYTINGLFFEPEWEPVEKDRKTNGP